MKHVKIVIVVNTNDPTRARNVALRMGARAELDGEIVRFEAGRAYDPRRPKF